MKPLHRYHPILLSAAVLLLFSIPIEAETAPSAAAEGASSMLFPVAGADDSHVVSIFGDGRDDGARLHEGVDIVAPRGTPVIAPVRAYVRRVGRTERGGNVITLHDRERDIYLFFAHLETQDVEKGVWVEPGQIIGTVGSSGNASDLYPHLHFSIYRGRWEAIDPAPFILPANPVPLEAVIRPVPASGEAAAP